MVGTVRLNPRAGPRINHGADILFLYVHPRNQNQGVGYQLMQTLIDRAKTIDNLQQLELSVSHDSRAALRLYQKLGFEETGRLKRQIRVGEVFYDLITMWRPL